NSSHNMLKQLANTLTQRVDRETTAKGDLQIAQGDFAAVSIQDRHQPSKDAREMETGLAEKQRNQLRCQKNPEPLKPVTNFFPTRTHGAFYTRRPKARELPSVSTQFPSAVGAS